MAIEAIRITRSIPMLMMMANDRQDPAERFERLADGLAIGRMLLHDVPLIGCELGSFFQNFVGNLDLAQIVQISSPLERNHALMLEVEMTSQRTSIVCQP